MHDPKKNVVLHKYHANLGMTETKNHNIVEVY